MPRDTATSHVLQPKLPNDCPALTVDPGDDVLERVDLELDPRLSERVVILDRVEQLREAPERVRLDGAQRVRRQRRHVALLYAFVCRKVEAQYSAQDLCRPFWHRQRICHRFLPLVSWVSQERAE